MRACNYQTVSIYRNIKCGLQCKFEAFSDYHVMFSSMTAPIMLIYANLQCEYPNQLSSSSLQRLEIAENENEALASQLTVSNAHLDSSHKEIRQLRGNWVVLKNPKVLWPGFEPGLLRPQRNVLTTRRSQLQAAYATEILRFLPLYSCRNCAEKWKEQTNNWTTVEVCWNCVKGNGELCSGKRSQVRSILTELNWDNLDIIRFYFFTGH